MAMKRHLTLTLREWQHHPITALGYCPPRREFLLGFEDGAIQWCDLENGKLSTSATEHHGMVTQFLYWPQPRLVFSSSIDGTLVVWTSGATILDRIQLGRPIFSISINVQRHMLVCGFKGQLIVFPLDERKVSGHVIDRAKGSSDHSHTDIVSQISCQDHHIYTTGYDKKLMVFDTYLNRDKQVLRVVHCNPRAHTAGITHLLIVRESESTRILTGSFDKTVGVWSQDAQLIYRITHFTGIITGLCYVPFVGTVWIASTNALPTLYDPRAGEIVSDFVDTFQDAEEGLALQRLLCPPEATHVVDDYKIPVIRRTFPLMEAGDAHFHSLYLVFKYLRQKIKRRASEISAGALHRKHQAQIKHCDCQRKQRINRQHQVFIWKYNCMGCVTILTGTHPIECLSYTAKIPILLFSGHSNGMVQKWERNHLSTFLYRSLFVEDLDILVMSAEDGDIYIWEFDDSITGSDSNHTDNQAEKKCLLPRGSISETPPPEHEKVTVINKREAGLICKKLLCGHSRTVSGLALVGLESGYGTVYLLSGGWDCRLCLWDLGSCTLKDTFSNPEEDRWSEAKEVACEGSILDLAYSPERRLFAYSSSDGQVYIRHFGQVSSEMTLVGVLQGHEADVTAILWHSRRDAWISGSEDGTVRIWDGNSSQCHRILNTKGAVSCLCIDQVNGSIIAGVHDTIRVYDAESLLQVQTNLGHKDCVQSVIHIPELKQYASASWDCTIRLWNAYNCPPPKL